MNDTCFFYFYQLFKNKNYKLLINCVKHRLGKYNCLVLNELKKVKLTDRYNKIDQIDRFTYTT